MQDSALEIEEVIASCQNAIESLALMVSAEDLFVAVVANLSIAPEDAISEGTHGTVPVLLELLAFHLYPYFGKSTSKVITPLHTQTCIDALKMLFNQRHLLTAINEPNAESSPVDTLIDVVRHQAEIVRGSAYPVQTEVEIAAIQGRFEQWFDQRSRLGPLRACEIINAIRQHHVHSVDSFSEELREYGNLHRDAWLNAKRKVEADRTDEEKELLGACGSKEAAWVFGLVARLNHIAVETLPASLDDVGKRLHSRPTSTEWDAIIDLIGMTPDARARLDKPVDVRDRPLFVLPDRRVLLIDVPTALDVLWERFEEIAKLDPKFFQQRYQRHKAQWLEESAVRYLARVFPEECIYRNLSYPDPDKESKEATAELDAAIQWGPFLILIEAKAKQFRFEAQLDDPGRLFTDIKANIADAFDQARRAARYIKVNPCVEFVEVSTGRKLVIQASQLNRIYIVTISQHHLANVASQLASLQDLGLFKESEYPLSVSIADLETILEFCDGPDVFLHYIERRHEIQSSPQHIFADELDYWGAYLDTRLQADRLWAQGDEKPNVVHLGGWTDRFDKWYRYRSAELDTPPEIKLNVPSEIHRILAELRRRDDDDAKWIAFSLLNMSDAALDTVAAVMIELHQQSMRPGTFRRITHQIDDTIVSIVASLDQPPFLLNERTAFRVKVEKYRRRARRSIGFGIMIMDDTKPFECAVWAEGPWKYDPRAERNLKAEPPFIPASAEKLPSRNAPCLCGSGKKFKHCCLPKIRNNSLMIRD